MSFLSPRFENGLLSRLSEPDLALLGPMERVELAPHNALEVANRNVESIYFIERGFASVVADDADGGIIEAVRGVSFRKEMWRDRHQGTDDSRGRPAGPRDGA